MSPTTLTKAETVALWHAISWMELCLRKTMEDGDVSPGIELERERLRIAKRALRKVNAIRRSQAIEAKAAAALRRRIDLLNSDERNKATGEPL